VLSCYPDFESKLRSNIAMLALSRSLLAITCFTCSLTAFGQENSLEDLLNSKSETSSEAATDSKGKLAPISFEDLPFSEYDLDFREWSDATGKFSVVGRFEGFGNGTVLLVRKDNGKEVEVKIELLAQPDVELLESIKKNIKTVEQIREQKEVTDLFADTRKVIGLLDELRSGMEKLARENTKKDEEAVRKKRAALRASFAEKLLSMRSATLPASILSICDAKGKAFWGEEASSTDRLVLIIEEGKDYNSQLKSEKLFKSITPEKLVNISFSPKSWRGSSLNMRVIGGLALTQDNKDNDGFLEMEMAELHALGAKSTAFWRNIWGVLGSAGRARGNPLPEDFNWDSNLAQNIWVTVSLERASVAQIESELFQQLLRSFKSRQIVNETYDWWGLYGSTIDQRKDFITTGKWEAMCRSISLRLRELSGQKFFGGSYNNGSNGGNQPRPLFWYWLQEPSDADEGITADCYVLKAEINPQTGEQTLVISLPVASNKVDVENRTKAWYSFRYQPTDFDGWIDVDGNYVLDGKPGKLVSEKLLAP